MNGQELLERYRDAYKRYTGEDIPVSIQPDGRFLIQHKDGKVIASEQDVHGWLAYLEGRPSLGGAVEEKKAEAQPPAKPRKPKRAPKEPTEPAGQESETRENIATLMMTKKRWKLADLSLSLELSRTAVLHHLRILREEGRVADTGKGPAVRWELVQKSAPKADRKSAAAPPAPAPAPPPPAAPAPEAEQDERQQARDQILATSLSRG